MGPVAASLVSHDLARLGPAVDWAHYGSVWIQKGRRLTGVTSGCSSIIAHVEHHEGGPRCLSASQIEFRDKWVKREAGWKESVFSGSLSRCGGV